MPTSIGVSFALLTQTRLQGGREEGLYLYLVTGEESAGPALADLQAVPQTRPLATALYLLRLTWRRRRLVVNGSVFPADGGDAAAVALSLRRTSDTVDAAEFWPSQPPAPGMTAATSNRVLAVACAGWIEHTVVDQTPGLRAQDIFLSTDPRSWGMFRAGSELSRLSYLTEAGDQYEHALAIDGHNIGALIDLAHLRRGAGHFGGAETLASNALELIEFRNREYRRWEDDEDPNWYRAQIVLATIHAEWAKAKEAVGDMAAADSFRTKAFNRSVEVANTAMSASTRLECFVGEENLERALERHDELQFLVRWRASWRARRKGRKFDEGRALQLYRLLQTTFEPGLLLLVASTGPHRDDPPPP
jgi:hypothetical protein